MAVIILLLAQVFLFAGNGQPRPQGSILLGYKPIRPSYHPNPSKYPQLVPPGPPWPAKPEDYDKPPWVTTQSNRPISTKTTPIATSTVSGGNVTQNASDPNALISNKINYANNVTSSSSTITTTTTTTTTSLPVTTSTTSSTTSKTVDESANKNKEARPTSPSKTDEDPSNVLYTSKPLSAAGTTSMVESNSFLAIDLTRNVSDLLTNRNNVDNSSTSPTTQLPIPSRSKEDEKISTASATTEKNDNKGEEVTHKVMVISSEKEEKPDSAETFSSSSEEDDEDGDKEGSNCHSDESFEIVRAVEISNPFIGNIQPFLTGVLFNEMQEEQE